MFGNLILQGVISDSLIGQIGTVTVDIPSFALDGNMTITMNADGTTSTTELVGTALSVDGRACGESQVYGYVKEYIEDDVAPQLVDIIASPSPIELSLTPSPETQMIAVIGSRGVMFSEVGILNSDCTFVSSEAAVATVSNEGLITAVGAGECTITVNHAASYEFHDDVSRTVSANIGAITAFHNSKERDIDISIQFCCGRDSGTSDWNGSAVYYRKRYGG